jgi:hypothetical protein
MITAAILLYATLSVVLPLLALWRGCRAGRRIAWRTAPVPAAMSVGRHRAVPERLYNDQEWTAMRLSAGGW